MGHKINIIFNNHKMDLLHVQIKVDDFVKQGFNSAGTSGLTLPTLGISTKKGQAVTPV